MTYTFRTRCELIKHLRALCELSGSIEHSALPMKDFETTLPYLLDDCLMIKSLSKKSSQNRAYKIYIAFRTTGFEASTIFHHFKSRVTAFQTSLIACYTIQFVDCHYTLQQFEL